VYRYTSCVRTPVRELCLFVYVACVFLYNCVHSYECIYKSRLAQAAFMLFSLLRYDFRIFLSNRLKYSVSSSCFVPGF